MVGKYIETEEEQQIRELLDMMAEKLGLVCSKKEEQRAGYYLDRLWFEEIEGEKVPVIAFEIEKGIPSNERIRKDLMNIALSKAPKGYIILPHERISADMNDARQGNWANWYKSNFLGVFSVYRSLFEAYCDIRLIDADKLQTTQCLKESIIAEI